NSSLVGKNLACRLVSNSSGSWWRRSNANSKRSGGRKSNLPKSSASASSKRRSGRKSNLPMISAGANSKRSDGRRSNANLKRNASVNSKRSGRRKRSASSKRSAKLTVKPKNSANLKRNVSVKQMWMTPSLRDRASGQVTLLNGIENSQK